SPVELSRLRPRKRAVSRTIIESVCHIDKFGFVVCATTLCVVPQTGQRPGRSISPVQGASPIAKRLLLRSSRTQYTPHHKPHSNPLAKQRIKVPLLDRLRPSSALVCSALVLGL